MSAVLRAAIDVAKAPPMGSSPATRHSFASRYVQAGGSLMKVASILGHLVLRAPIDRAGRSV